MARGIWSKLPKPLLIQAPMEEVTDTVFRQILEMSGRPDIFFTEFTNAQGYNSSGRENVAHRLKFTPKERPIIAQIWGLTPEDYFKFAKELVGLGFDGIDINMGCPVEKIIKKGCCSALINNHPLASEIIKAAKEGAGALPVSVKTRIGFNEIVTEEWIGFLLEHQLDALTVHGRTTRELSKVPNRWEEIEKAVDLRNRISPETVLIGNGDVTSLDIAYEKIEKHRLDGVMVGRALLENQWFFNKDVVASQITPQMRIELFIKHIELFDQTWGASKNFAPLKKFVKAYVKGFEGAGEARELLMRANSVKELLEGLKGIKLPTGFLL